MTTNEELRALAEQAAPGEWLLVDHNEGMRPPRPLWGVVNDDFLDPSGDEDAESMDLEIHVGDKTDAKFIAAANPARVLALLDEVERLRAQVERVRELHERGEVIIVSADGAQEPRDTCLHCSRMQPGELTQPGEAYISPCPTIQALDAN